MLRLPLPEDDPRWDDSDWYYYPKSAQWIWIGDYDANDPRNNDDDWAYLPELGGWTWIGEGSDPSASENRSHALVIDDEQLMFITMCILFTLLVLTFTYAWKVTVYGCT